MYFVCTMLGEWTLKQHSRVTILMAAFTAMFGASATFEKLYFKVLVFELCVSQSTPCSSHLSVNK